MLDQVIQFFLAGGWVMYPLLLLSLISLTLIFERSMFWVFGRQRRGAHRMHAYIALLAQGESDQARSESERDQTLEGVLVQRSLRSTPVNESLMIGQIESLRPVIERFAPTLGTIIAAAPLLGILGTVTGIIQSFDLLGEAASVSDPSVVAGGIAEALYTTAFGLSIALITLFPHVYFKACADRALGRLETLAGALLDRPDSA
ncbi:MAG: MotA/TolQ/ExbB proton channel family protein [Phycisphaerales bacterium JB052]